MVIFDEIFRGTNVKDAYDATLMVSEGFSKIKSSLFFISSHITEVGEELKTTDDIECKCLESTLENGIPVYHYKLESGISTERLGLTIIENENLMKIINQSV